MELREFAEQVLFSASIEAKLHCPAHITDDRPGLPIATPDAPSRPNELRFKPAGSSKGGFPGIHRLAQSRERGRLLHFFANHELLATELMALVLLRFPEAPAGFRRGVLRTLKEEQEHTRLYLERMGHCGVQFGELPVSGYFWRAVAGMETPMDYVAGLSLTFEQANLDYARYFSHGFAAVGDADSARLLNRIYHDEIGHVAYGLKWFRRWKQPGASDWEAFCRQLKFPLSPQRAKGFAVNFEGRRAAGFDASFIDELNIFSQSRGRTPGVYVFNPFAEGYIAQGRAFTPVRHQSLLASDLSNLPQFLCRQDDIVLVERRPSVWHLSGLKRAGFALPEFVELTKPDLNLPESLGSRKLGALHPWAWGPDSVQLLSSLFSRVTQNARRAEECFNPGIAHLYEKTWSANLLRRFLSARPREPWLCHEQEVGLAAETLDEALRAVAAIRRRGHHRVVAKASVGLAGHNALRLWEPEVLEAQRRWMGNTLRHGPLVIEPWLDRALDFSLQLEMGTQGLKVVGYTGLLNDRKGQYQGNWAAANFDRCLPSPVLGLFRTPKALGDRINALYKDLLRLIEEAVRKLGYQGPFGIDAFVYHDEAGEFRLKPVVEINPRFTMGRVTIELMRRVAPGGHGLFRLVSRAMARAEGFEDFRTYARSLTERFPIKLEGEPVPRIREGAICLNDPTQAQVCLATFRVDRTLDELLSQVPMKGSVRGAG